MDVPLSIAVLTAWFVILIMMIVELCVSGFLKFINGDDNAPDDR